MAFLDYDRNDPPIEALAYHEAGHAALHFALNLEFEYITINEFLGNWGHVRPGSECISITQKLKDNQPLSDNEKMALCNYIKIMYAGPVAEGRFKGEERWQDYKSSGNDLSGANELLIKVFGNDPVENKKTELAYIEEVRMLFSVDKNWNMVEKIAQNLLDKKHLTFEECKSL